MKYTKYKVHFTNGEYEEVWALGSEQAKILAQAEQIKKGNSYEIEYLAASSGGESNEDT